MAKYTILEYYKQVIGDRVSEKFALQSLESKRITAMVLMAQSDQDLVITPEQLDRHPFFLNCLNGTVDIRTGILSPHERGHFITKLVHCHTHPRPSVTCS